LYLARMSRNLWLDGGWKKTFLALGLLCTFVCRPLQGATVQTDTHRTTAESLLIEALAGPRAPKAILGLLLQKHFAVAQAELALLARSEPNDAEVANLQGVLFLLQGQLPQAQRSFETVLSEHPGFYVATRNLGITLWHEHQTASAARQLQMALRENPDDKLTNLYLGQVYFAGRDCTDSIKAFKASGDFLLREPAPMFMNVVCDAQAGDVNEAADLLIRMRGKPQLPPQDLFQFALQSEQSGQYRLAFLALKLVPPGFPDTYTHAFDTALAAYQSKDYDATRTILGKLHSDGKATPESLDLLGNTLEELGIIEKKPQMVKEAYDAYRQGIYKDPHYLPNFIDIARLALKLGNYSLGESLLTQGLASNPDAYQLILERGMAYAFDGHVALAARDFSNAKKLDPHGALPYMAQGILDIQENRYDQAVADLRDGIKQSSAPNAWLYYLLARALHDRGQVTPADDAEMRHALQETIRLDSKFKEAYELAGLVWMKSGDYDQAERYLKTARKLDPGNRHCVYELAMIKRLQHQPDAAARYFKIFEHLEATNNQARMRKYFMKIMVNQQSGNTLQEAQNSDDGR